MNAAKVLEYRTPPQCIEIEESVLAACILFPEPCSDAVSLLTKEDFYKPAHRRIFEAVTTLVDQKAEVNAASIVEHLRAWGQLETIGGATYIFKIMDAPIPANMAHYSDRLKKYAQLRQIIQVCGTTMSACYEQRVDNLDEIINKFQAQALSAGTGLQPSWVTKEELTGQSLLRYQDLNEGESYRSLPTGFPSLDRVTGGGFRGPKLVIIAARPGVGKTALMGNLTYNQAQKGIRAGVISLEMDKAEIDDRWIAAGAQVNAVKLSAEPGPNASEWARIKRAADEQAAWPVLIDDNPADIHELKRRIRQMVKAGAEIIYIDQLSGIGGNRNKSAFERNTEHVEELKFLKKELRIPIVLLAQLNRDLEKREAKKPKLSDLKNTGQLEEDADIVLMGYRPVVYADNADEGLSDYAEWEVAKNRQGPTWNIKMNWTAKYQQFTERTDY